jgi:hypothetical protein
MYIYIYICVRYIENDEGTPLIDTIVELDIIASAQVKPLHPHNVSLIYVWGGWSRMCVNVVIGWGHPAPLHNHYIRVCDRVGSSLYTCV